jgi:hypothetical protein
MILKIEKGYESSAKDEGEMLIVRVAIYSKEYNVFAANSD